MIRILHIVSSLGTAGGVQKMLYNYYQHMDKTQVQFDFATHATQDSELKHELKKIGSTIFHVPHRIKHPIKHRRELRAILRQGQYDIIHDHLNSHAIFSISVAKQMGIKGRIVHSHATNSVMGIFKGIRHLFVWALKHMATDFFACGEGALSYLMGKGKDKYRTNIIHNAIDLELYRFSKEKRDDIRRRLGIENAFVIGHVGRFDPVKNHSFIVDVFAHLKQKEKNAKLVLVGDGILLQDVKDKVHRLGVQEDVLFMGVRSDVCDLMQAMDVLLLPSESEGLGLVTIEAQAADLPCICSTGVPREVDLTGKMAFLPLDNLDLWCDEIIKHRDASRQDCSAIIAQQGYDIRLEAERLMALYTQIVKRD